MTLNITYFFSNTEVDMGLKLVYHCYQCTQISVCELKEVSSYTLTHFETLAVVNPQLNTRGKILSDKDPKYSFLKINKRTLWKLVKSPQIPLPRASSGFSTYLMFPVPLIVFVVT